MANLISKAQIRVIRARQHVLGMDNDDYHDLIAREFSVESTTELTSAQGHELMTMLYGGPAPKKTRRRRKAAAKAAPGPAAAQAAAKADNVIALASRAQTEFIEELVSEVAWDAPGGFERWLRSSLGMDRVRTNQDAQQVIEGLKGLKAHGHAA